MLDKVLFNLLSNAFKFTGENGTITVTIDKLTTENMALIKVEDLGIGMDTTHAFELFSSNYFPGQRIGFILVKRADRYSPWNHYGKK